MKDIMSSQKISLRENKNIRVNLQDAQIAQRTVQDSKLHYNLTVIRQDRADSIFILKKDV